MFPAVLLMEVAIILAFLDAIRGTWLPFVILLPFYLAGVTLIVKIYQRYINYLCPACDTKFCIQGFFKGLVSVVDFVFSSHPRTVEATCPSCNHKGDCEEIYIKTTQA
jgi:hypothetical protein